MIPGERNALFGRPLSTVPEAVLSVTFSLGASLNPDSLLTSQSDETVPTEEEAPKRPRRKAKHITFAPMGDDVVDQPIHASGFYNIGDDIGFDEGVTLPERRKVKRHRPAKPVASREPIVAVPQKVSKFPSLLEKLNSAEWNEQNEAIIALIAESDQFCGEIRANLVGMVDSLLRCAGSLRSALAKNALNCLIKWITWREISFAPICEHVAESLLTLVSVQRVKHFIADLSGQCFAEMIAAIPVAKAVAICTNEQRRRKNDGPRTHIALALTGLAARTTDCSGLLRPLVPLVRDKCPDVRNAAKAAIVACRSQCQDFGLVLGALPQEDQVVLRSAL
jgi:hypothetical protein